MMRNVYQSFLSVIVVWLILGGIQGHPHRRFSDQRSHNVSTPEGNLPNNNEPQFTEFQRRESLTVKHEPRTKLSAVDVRQHIDSDGKIVFPSDLPYIGLENYTLPVVPVCATATFCENPPHYPSELIKNALKFRNDLKHLATIDEVPEIGQRIDADGDEPLCIYEDKVIFPKTAKSKDNQWLYVVNEADFPQGVRIEECMTENTACRLIDGFSEGYKTSCKQKYIYRQLAAVSPHGSLDTNYFRFAASCCCHVKFTANAATRFGAMAGGVKTNSQSPAPRKITSLVGGNEKK